MQFALQTPEFFARLFARPAAPRITRRYGAWVRQGRTQEIPRAGKRMTVHCRDGEAWITHDGDPRDVLLQPRQSYTADRGERMTLHALKGDCEVEIEVDL
jgi:hypothetical protein